MSQSVTSAARIHNSTIAVRGGIKMFSSRSYRERVHVKRVAIANLGSQSVAEGYYRDKKYILARVRYAAVW